MYSTYITDREKKDRKGGGAGKESFIYQYIYDIR